MKSVTVDRLVRVASLSGHVTYLKPGDCELPDEVADMALALPGVTSSKGGKDKDPKDEPADDAPVKDEPPKAGSRVRR